jgi:poly(3-hydroxybutyrate) depolymerase
MIHGDANDGHLTSFAKFGDRRALKKPCKSHMPITAFETSVAAPREARSDVLVDGAFTNFAGTRDYKLYLPANLARDPPLFVMLHGCSQSAVDFACGTRMNELNWQPNAAALFCIPSNRSAPICLAAGTGTTPSTNLPTTASRP